MNATVSVRSFLDAVADPLIEEIGLAGFRSVSKRTQELMGEGGSTREWMMAMARAVTELDNPRAEAAFLTAFRTL